MVLKTRKVYKIRDKETGLYAMGGSNTSSLWSKTGKTYSNIGHLKNHLHSFIERGLPSKDYPYHNAEIVSWEIKHEESERVGVNDLVAEMSAS